MDPKYDNDILNILFKLAWNLNALKLGHVHVPEIPMRLFLRLETILKGHNLKASSYKSIREWIITGEIPDPDHWFG